MKISNKMLVIAVVALAATLTGCKSYQGVWSKAKLPQGDSIISQYSQALDQPVDSSALGNLGWREVFTDPLLQSYIEQALANNANLKNAKLNIDIAQAQLQGAKLSYFPSITFSPNASKTRVGDNTSDWGWQLPFAASWQIDAFGQITNNKRSAESQVAQSQAYSQAVQAQLIASVATCYYTLVAMHNELDIYDQNAKLSSTTVKSMKDMKDAGRYTQVAVEQSEAQYHSIMASIPDLKLSITQTNNSMSLLLNTQPREWPVNTASELKLPAKFNAGVPMSYLAARPDVRSSEQSFAQAYYATNIARANFYPQINITGTAAYGTLMGTSVIDPAKWLLNLAGSLTQPLFNRGRIVAQYKAAKLQQEQALNNFQYAILNASSEVSNSLAYIDCYSTKQQSVELQEKNLERAVEYNTDLLNLYTTTYIEVLSAQQSLLSSQLQLENVKLNNNIGIINLYQALGGGR